MLTADRRILLQQKMLSNPQARELLHAMIIETANIKPIDNTHAVQLMARLNLLSEFLNISEHLDEILLEQNKTAKQGEI